MTDPANSTDRRSMTEFYLSERPSPVGVPASEARPKNDFEIIGKLIERWDKEDLSDFDEQMWPEFHALLLEEPVRLKGEEP